MRAKEQQVLAMGGGGFSMEPGNPRLDDYALALTGKDHPRVCFLPTASGDADHYIVRFYQVFGEGRTSASHLSLFRREKFRRISFREHLLNQDLVYVGGGSVLAMLGAWRGHGIDAHLIEAWQNGVIMAGQSAGSLCWFQNGITVFQRDPQSFQGLGLLPFSAAVHYHNETGRRDAYLDAVARGVVGDGYACDDGAALHFRGQKLDRVVLSRPESRAYHVTRRSDTEESNAYEEELASEYLTVEDPYEQLTAVDEMRLEHQYRQRHQPRPRP